MACAEIAENHTCLYLCSNLATLRRGHIMYEDCVKNESIQENEQCFRCRTETKQEEAEVFCTYCVHPPVPAVKTCLICEASLCEEHLMVHNESPDHVLIEPTTSLHCEICTVHNEVLKYYCPEDDSVVCTSCIITGAHRGHPVESLEIASDKKKEQLKSLLKKRNSRKQKTQKRIKDLQTEMSSVKDKAKAITDRVAVLFTDLRSQLDALERRVLRDVSRQEEQVVLALSERVQELEMKMERLSKQISKTEELCQTTDPLVVVQGCLPKSITRAGGSSRRMSDEHVLRVESLDEVLIFMTLHRNLATVVSNVTAVEQVHVLEASEILLDENTAGDYVFISGDRKTACKSNINLRRPETPERFYCAQVLSTKSFSSGPHSWEVEASNSGDWMIGVAYSTIERKGPLSFLGINDRSWCLQKSNNKYSVKHNLEVIQIDVEYSCQRYLVYLDHEAGRLSFYQLSDPICHLYTYKTIFNAPLRAAFWVEDNAWLQIRNK